MMQAQETLRVRLLVGFFLSVPVAGLVFQILAWLVFGLDLPFFDDWRGYARGNIASLDPRYLFSPVNDTQSPVGLALDALALRYLHGNSIAYQFLSMTIVLGSLLFLQWRLLWATLGDRLLAAAAFSLTVFMLQPGSYWGRENLAYHHAIPLVCLLAAFHLILVSTGRLALRAPVVLLLGLLAGFTYISGAFAVLVSAVIILGCAVFLEADQRRPLIQATLPLFLAGLVTVTSQVFAVTVGQIGRLHRSDFPIAWPDSREFWFFLLGKVGRALLLPAEHPLRSLPLVLLVVLLVAVISFMFTRRLISRRLPTLDQARLAIIFLALGASISVYLALVSAGRANLRPAEMSSVLEIFAFAFTRFHFFWVTLLWPWCAAAVLVWLSARWGSSRPRAVRIAASILAVVVIVTAWFAGAFDHSASFRNESQSRLETIACLQSEIAKGNGISCNEFSWGNLHDLSSGYMLARELDASFIRYFPVLPSTSQPAPLLTWSGVLPDQSVQRKLVELPGHGPSVAGSAAEGAAMIVLRTDQPEIMARCLRLEVGVELRAGLDDKPRVFYREVGQGGLVESLPTSARLFAATVGARSVSFIIESRTGLVDELRLLPARQNQTLSIEKLEVRCRMARGIPRNQAH